MGGWLLVLLVLLLLFDGVCVCGVVWFCCCSGFRCVQHARAMCPDLLHFLQVDVVHLHGRVWGDAAAHAMQ